MQIAQCALKKKQSAHFKKMADVVADGDSQFKIKRRSDGLVVYTVARGGYSMEEAVQHARESGGKLKVERGWDGMWSLVYDRPDEVLWIEPTDETEIIKID